MPNEKKLIGQTSKITLQISHAFRELLFLKLHNFIFKVLKKKVHKPEGLPTACLLSIINTQAVHAAQKNKVKRSVGYPTLEIQTTKVIN